MIQNDLIRIKNAYLARQKEVVLPYSKLTESVALVLSKKGYVGEVAVVAKSPRKEISIQLRYTQGVPHLNDLTFLSKPGRRLYVRTTTLHNVRQGYGDLIVSTSQGVMTAKEAKKKGLGGEMLCEVF